MTPRPSFRRKALLTLGLAAALASIGLAGCGKLGDLERPGPMFGHGRTGAAEQSRPTQDPNRPVQTVDPRDENGAILDWFLHG